MAVKELFGIKKGEGQAKNFNIDYGSDEPQPAGLYDAAGLATALPGPASVDAKAIEFYREQGYLAVNDIFSSKQVEDAKQALTDLIAGKNPDFNNLMLERAGANADLSTPEQREAVVRKIMSFCKYDARLHAIAHDPKIFDIVERMAGEKVTVYQEMALLKPPQGREKPWHQDHAYFDLKLKKHVVGIWIALDEALVANGCMHIMPGKHREPVLHFKKRDWQICDTTAMQMKPAFLAVPLRPGGVLFFDSLLPHGTPQNNSTLRRRALQFHYKPVSAEDCPTEDRLKVFGSEGKNVTC